MGRWGVGLLLLSVIAAACGGGDAGESATSTSTASTTTTLSTTTTTAATTTTDLPGPIELQLRGLGTSNFDLAAGQRYSHVVGATPIEFDFASSGWELAFVGQRIVFIGNESTEQTLAAGLFFLADVGAEEIKGQMIGFTPTAASTEFTDATLGGQSAVVFDVELAPGEPDQARRGVCSGGGSVLIEEVGVDPTGSGTADELFLFGGFGCAWNRIWVVRVDGGSIVLIAADPTLELDPNPPPNVATLELGPVLPLIDELTAAITLGAG